MSNDDPIAIAGVQALTGALEFPVLCYTPNKEIVKGFKEGEYDRLVKAYHVAASTGAFSPPVGGQPDSGQVQATPTEAATGTA